jgi:hypothetical protein
MENLIAIINIIMLAGIAIGVYKNKVDSTDKHSDKIEDINNRLIRLEEKTNFIYQTIKNHK